MVQVTAHPSFVTGCKDVMDVMLRLNCVYRHVQKGQSLMNRSGREEGSGGGSNGGWAGQ